MEWHPILTEGGIHDVYKESMESHLIRRDEVMELFSSNSKAVVRA